MKDRVTEKVKTKRRKEKGKMIQKKKLNGGGEADE